MQTYHIHRFNTGTTGIQNQDWSQVSTDLIKRSDLEEYFALLESRARKAGRGNGSGMKGQQKTLINKLFAIIHIII